MGSVEIQCGDSFFKIVLVSMYKKAEGGILLLTAQPRG